ncbi:transposase [Streptomyces sp. NPDC059917]|uniref:transposase n=1 Tax=Streptomyces sp. NPDC059917 TaxID=3347002 RepID=UPI003664C46C
MPPPLFPRLQTSPPTRTEVATGVPAAAQDRPKPRRVVRWIMTNPQHLAAADAAELKEIRMACPHLDAAARHVHDFAEMLHHLRGDQLPDWMERVLADDLPALHSLVSGLRRDFDAVTAGLSTPCSFGQIEGHVTRVKLIKRNGLRPSQPRPPTPTRTPGPMTLRHHKIPDRVEKRERSHAAARSSARSPEAGRPTAHGTP